VPRFPDAKPGCDEQSRQLFLRLNTLFVEFALPLVDKRYERSGIDQSDHGMMSPCLKN
jgi:hypothetical protein